ncbi:competence protein CoiA [Mesorhizobium sp. B283B1A]|uniref:competence protein CoiA family protein n=1 Tax=Mesorhizobium TaxID=68287 RepID=UPI001CD10A86|nr:MULTISPECIES: competence protein CoiA family protein [Mesorhizobium]MCA0050632.1 competence protein CoiA [Mesorhizobium sp. B283B1A]UQS66936.1 competence protein CoiA [Mesorhizobium opportunistum]
MDDHKNARISFGTDRAQLVYGLRPDGTLAHISEVQRGIACGCDCPACGGRLVARKGDENVPHFGHHGGDACGGGPETVLHLLAKEVFRADPSLLLPKRLGLNKGNVVTKPGQQVTTQFLRIEFTDAKKVIPDLYVRALGYDLFVEVAVTHASDETKIERLREHGVMAVEIDLSKLPRDSTREQIADAVLRSAPRCWLYHPDIDKAMVKSRADEETWQAAQEKRFADYQARHENRVYDLTRAYVDAVRQLAGKKIVVPRDAELQAVGLAEHVGIEVAGYACFTVPPAVWQAAILGEVFHDKCLGGAVAKAVPIAKHLEKNALIRPQFQRVTTEVANGVAVAEPHFAPAWKAIDNYLQNLLGKGVLVQQGYGVTLERSLADKWTARTLAETQRTAVVHAAVQAVDWILAELPAEERGDMTGESWLDSIHAESSMTYRAAIESDIEAPKIAAEIHAVVAMFGKSGAIPHTALGLPIRGAIERCKAQRAKQAEGLRQKQIQEANRLRQSRRDRLCVDAETELSGPNLGAFLDAKRDDLSGMTPLEAAEDSESGLTKARGVLSAEVQRKRYQEKITADAKQSLSAKHVDTFLNGRDDDLERTTPLLYVRDDATYRKALGKLAEWQRGFGGPF